MENKTIKQMLQDGECEYGEGNTMCLVATEASPTIPKSMFWKGKAKNFPGVQEVIKQNGSK